jgi:hypothetical protein
METDMKHDFSDNQYCELYTILYDHFSVEYRHESTVSIDKAKYIIGTYFDDIFEIDYDDLPLYINSSKGKTFNKIIEYRIKEGI